MRLQAPRASSPMMEIYLRRWADLYRRRFYQLALFEIRAGIDRLGKSSVLRFLEAQTLLNLHRPEIARDIIDSIAEAPNESLLSEERAIRALGDNLKDAIEEFNKAYKANPKLAGPGEPFAWLEDPDLICKGGNLVAAVSGGTLVGSHIPGSLIEPIDIFPDRDLVLSEVRKQAISDAEALAKEALEALAETDPDAVEELKEIKEQVVWEPDVEGVKKEKPRLGKPKIMGEPVKAPEPVVSKSPTSSAKESLEEAWEEWQTTFRELVSEGKSHQALAHVEKATERFPDHPDLAEFKARILEELGSEEEAADSLVNAATTAYRKGRREDADRLIDYLLTLRKVPSRTLVSIAGVLAAGGLGFHAAKVLQEVVPRLRQERDMDGMREALTQLSRLRPGDKNVQADLGALTRKMANTTRRSVTATLPPPVKQIARAAIPKVQPPKDPPSVQKKVVDLPPPPVKKLDDIPQPPRVLAPPKINRPAAGEETPREPLFNLEDAPSTKQLNPREELASVVPVALILFVVGGIFVLGGAWVGAVICAFLLQKIRGNLVGKRGLDMELHVMKIGVIVLYVGAALAFLGRRVLF